MSDYMPVVGQLYIVRTRGEYAADGAIEKMTIVMQAANQDEIQSKLRFMLDISKYRVFSVTSAEKIRPRYHVIKTNIVDRKDHDAFVAARKDENAAPEVRSHDSEESKRFAFGIAGHLFATCEEHALRRIGSWLLGLGLDRQTKSPMSDGSVLQIEEEGPIDSTVTTSTQLSRMDATHFRDQRPLSGGLPSLGRR